MSTLYSADMIYHVDRGYGAVRRDETKRTEMKRTEMKISEIVVSWRKEGRNHQQMLKRRDTNLSWYDRLSFRRRRVRKDLVFVNKKPPQFTHDRPKIRERKFLPRNKPSTRLRCFVPRKRVDRGKGKLNEALLVDDRRSRKKQKRLTMRDVKRFERHILEFTRDAPVKVRPKPFDRSRLDGVDMDFLPKQVMTRSTHYVAKKSASYFGASEKAIDVSQFLSSVRVSQSGLSKRSVHESSAIVWRSSRSGKIAHKHATFKLPRDFMLPMPSVVKTMTLKPQKTSFTSRISEITGIGMKCFAVVPSEVERLAIARISSRYALHDLRIDGEQHSRLFQRALHTLEFEDWEEVVVPWVIQASQIKRGCLLTPHPVTVTGDTLPPERIAGQTIPCASLPCVMVSSTIRIGERHDYIDSAIREIFGDFVVEFSSLEDKVRYLENAWCNLTAATKCVLCGMTAKEHYESPDAPYFFSDYYSTTSRDGD